MTFDVEAFRRAGESMERFDSLSDLAQEILAACDEIERLRAEIERLNDDTRLHHGGIS